MEHWMKVVHGRNSTQMQLFFFPDEAEEGDEEPVEDLLKPGHLTRLLDQELEAEVEALSVANVNAGVSRLLSCLRSHRDSCHSACRMLVRFQPLLGIYSDLVRYYLSVSVGVHRSTGKLLCVLSSIFTELAQKVPIQHQDLMRGQTAGKTGTLTVCCCVLLRVSACLRS
uniref:Uncharacterized protein n=1 Tax=Fundulus heteroclitus TaxID=8078 RepID=A0A3Q2P9S6_FUNHE